MMIEKSTITATDAYYQNECACAYPSSTLAVGRARLLYQILHASGLDETREIRTVW
mgnify:CR=1 FL=1